MSGKGTATSQLLSYLGNRSWVPCIKWRTLPGSPHPDPRHETCSATVAGLRHRASMAQRAKALPRAQGLGSRVERIRGYCRVPNTVVFRRILSRLYVGSARRSKCPLRASEMRLGASAGGDHVKRKCTVESRSLPSQIAFAIILTTRRDEVRRTSRIRSATHRNVLGSVIPERVQTVKRFLLDSSSSFAPVRDRRSTPKPAASF